MLSRVTPGEAARFILEHVQVLRPEPRPLKDSLDRVLAEDVASEIDLPPWDNSSMDGYAARTTDVRGATTQHPVVLELVETVAAGQFPSRAISQGRATRVFTGSPVPEGADCVIRQEDVEVQGAGRVAVRSDRDAGHNIRRRGEDVRRGASVLGRGTLLGPAQIGVLASIAHARPLVHPAPRVAFFGSGEEIVDLDEAGTAQVLAGRKIASANSYTLDGMIRRAGAIPRDLGLAGDDRAAIAAKFEQAAGADLIVTTGGVSVGEHDHVRAALADLGGALELWRVRMRPGAPLGFGSLRGTPWIGLPGNPVSTMVTFELFARPAIRRMQGYTRAFRETVLVQVGEPIQLGPPLQHFLRVVVRPEPDGQLVARLTGAQGSGILTSMAHANALLIVPEDRASVPTGTMLPAISLEEDGARYTSLPPF